MTSKGRQTIDFATYQKAVSYYSLHPGDITGCARHIGRSIKIASRFWHGPPYSEPALQQRCPVPIREVLEKEAQAALAMRARQEREERQVREAEDRARERDEASVAREARVRASAEEQQLMAGARAVLRTQIANHIQHLGQAVPIIAAKAAQHAATCNPEEAMAMYRELVVLSREYAKATVILEQGGRASRGEPTQVVELKATPLPQNYGDALDSMRKVLALAERTPDLVVEVAGEEAVRTA